MQQIDYPPVQQAPCATNATNCLARARKGARKGERKAESKAKSPSSNANCATALAP